MKYALLIYTTEDGDPVECAKKVELFNREATEAGVLLAVQPLKAVSTATCVRVREGEALVVDGPFAETKEHLAGFYLLDCDNPEEWAAKLPMIEQGSIEIRPIWDLETPTEP